jgi:hypothetical protein
MSNQSTFSNLINRLHERTKEYYAFLISFSLSFIFCYFVFWQLSIVAGIIAGLFYTRMRKGALQGTLGLGIAWSLFVVLEILTSNVEELINQISGIVIGSTNLGWLFIVIIILLGFAFGALSGAIGSGIRFLIENRKKE